MVHMNHEEQHPGSTTLLEPKQHEAGLGLAGYGGWEVSYKVTSMKQAPQRLEQGCTPSNTWPTLKQMNKLDKWDRIWWQEVTCGSKWQTFPQHRQYGDFQVTSCQFVLLFQILWKCSLNCKLVLSFVKTDPVLISWFFGFCHLVL